MKYYSVLSLFLASVFSAGAQTLLPVQSGTTFPESGTSTVRAAKAERAGEAIDYMLADDPVAAINFDTSKAGSQVAMAFCLSKEDAALLAGNNITHINFYSGFRSNTQLNYITEATVFISETLTGTPALTQTTELSGEGGIYNSVILDSPYTITGRNALYIGMYCTLTNANDLTIVIDGAEHGNITGGGYAGIRQSATAAWNWIDTSTQGVGFVCVGATIDGDNRPENAVLINGLEVGPTVIMDKEFSAKVELYSKSVTPVSNVELSYTVGDGAKQTANITLKKALSFLERTEAEISGIVCSEGGSGIPFSVYIDKVNGNDNLFASKRSGSELVSLPEGGGYPRNIVIEEGTGSWCPYCPMGIVTLEKIRTEYSDGSFIPLAVHSQDYMESPDFSDVITFFPTFPNAIVNRSIIIYPNDDVFPLYEELRAIPALAKVEAKCAFTNETLSEVTFNTSTEFIFDDDNSRYALAFAITEDGVGPYVQKNGYSGGNNGPCGGWEYKGSSVSTIFNDVARQLESFSGLEGSIPSNITGGQKYEFSHTMKLDSKIKSKSKINCIVYLMDTTTGEIVNACMVKSEDIDGNTAVRDIIADSNDNTPAVYYNLQGIRVENPSNGIYLRRQGGKTQKVCR